MNHSACLFVCLPTPPQSCSFTNNTVTSASRVAGAYGGAIWASDISSLNLTSTDFKANQAVSVNGRAYEHASVM